MAPTEAAREPGIESAFRRAGFESLTPIQSLALPLLRARRHCLLVAPTGSGKTESSVIPIFRMVSSSRRAGRIKALYVTPLRALNRDVFRRIARYAEAESLSLAVRHGDTTQAERRRISRNPPDVLITTPETLVVLLSQPVYLEALSELEWAIIDEVHELLPSERGSQLSLSMERLQLASRLNLTRVGLSATVADPEAAASFVAGTGRPCEVARDPSSRGYEVNIEYVEGTITDAADAIARHAAGRGAGSPALLFSNTRGEAEFLASALRERSALRVDLHHGSLSRGVREEAEESLRAGSPDVVVCTSSLELGLDIGSVDLVIHYGSPRQASKLVQRIGRSRHAARAPARGIIVTNSADDEFEARAILERVSEGGMEEQRPHEAPLGVLAHHAVGLAMQAGRVRVSDALRVFSGAHPYRNLSEQDLVSVLELLDSSYLVSLDRGSMEYGQGRRSFRYHFENLSTIPDMLRFRVLDVAAKRFIGTLDQRFVGDHGEPGATFVLRGSQWKIVSTDESALTVNVEPAGGGRSRVPYWEGETIPVERATASGVGRLRARPAPMSNKLMDSLGLEPIPDSEHVAVESAGSDGTLVLHACFGTRINSTLSAALSSVLSAELGSPVEGRSDAYRVALSPRGRLSEQALRAALSDEYDLHEVLSASLSGTHNINWAAWCVAKKFGMVPRDSTYERRSARFLYERHSGTPLAREALRGLLHAKYDVPGAGEVLRGIREGRIRVSWHARERFSALAEPILDHAHKYYSSSPSSIDKGIMEMVRARLLKTRHRLVCMRCGKWERSVESGSLERVPPCPQCRGRQVTATYYSDTGLPELVRRNRSGAKLSAEERHLFDRAWKVSSLLAEFGTPALIVLSGYGVGADTAARILRDMLDEEGMYRQIYEAERQYVMTRGFWD